MSLRRYTQPRQIFAKYVPKKPLSVHLQHKIQYPLPPLIIPTKNDQVKNQAPKIPNKISLGSSLSQNNMPVVDNEISKSISLSANRHIIQNEVTINPLPQLPSPKSPEFSSIFTDKIKICNLIFNFNESSIQMNSKMVKFDALSEISALLSNKSEVSLITNQQKDLIYDMILNNIFDQDPFIAYESTYSPTIKWSFVEPSWPHLSLVFQILIQYLTVFPERCKIDLVYKAIRLMNIPDQNERENLGTFLTSYATIHPEQLDQIWKILQNALINVISNIYTPYCVLPIISFINSSICPKKFSQILHTHLLPLYRNEQLYIYSNALTNLVRRIVDNDSIGQNDVLNFLINNFPYQCGRKQFLFISAINSILDIFFDLKLNEIAPKLIFFLGLAIKSPNTKLAESASRMLLKPTMTSLFFRNINLAMKSLYEPLIYTSSSHWDITVKSISKKVRITLENISYEVRKNGPVSVSTNSSRLPVQIDGMDTPTTQNEVKKSDNSELVAKWALVARCASRKDDSIDLTITLLHIQEKLLNEEKNPKCNYLQNNRTRSFRL